jgi:hypothetical protein
MGKIRVKIWKCANGKKGNKWKGNIVFLG